MTDEQIEQEADRLTTRTYVRRGIFGGQVPKGGVSKGVVKRVRYFDYAGVKQQHINQLRRERDKEAKALQ